jgi:hypothetical protein
VERRGRKKHGGKSLILERGVERAQQFKGVEGTRESGPKSCGDMQKLEYAGEGGRRLVRLGRAGEGARAGRGLGPRRATGPPLLCPT